MRGIIIYLCLLTGLFYFSEGKPCPEKSRAHKTRCDAFYKCRELPSNSHVWIPVKCQEGLVYEHNVGSCVLPGEDWECITPSELASSTSSSVSKDADILIVNSEDEAGLLLNESSQLLNDDDNVQIVLDATLSSEEQDVEHNSKLVTSTTEHSEDENSAVNQFDSSGDGELVDLDIQRRPENREGEVKMSPNSSHSDNTHVVTTSQQPSSSIDPNLTAHLQRLSQLIDGLQQKYQKTEKPQQELRPDQLNAFLAHFDLKNRYDMLNPMGNYKEPPISSTTMPTTTTTSLPASSSSELQNALPEPTANKTLLQEHLTRHRMQPETKVLLSNTQPFAPYGAGYGNSQIVVNRPEGSVTFTLPQYGLSGEQSQQQTQLPSPQTQPYGSAHSHEFSEHEPKISEETLKTVLELSKQMIAAQNLPKVLPNPAYNNAYYAQPILQPLIISPQNNPFQQYYAMPGYESLQPSRTHYVHHKKASSYSKKQPSTTIIHNNVIPVHVSSTSSGEKEVLDTYGNSLGVYPTLDKHNPVDKNNYYNKFIATMTTARPSSSVSVTTMSSQYTGQYAAPYPSEYAQTTPRPFEQQPSPATVANFYTPSPHLNDNNVNRVFQAESYLTGSQNMPHPMDTSGLFPTQLEPDQVKIRPNSQKIESMEVEPDDSISANYVNNNRHNILTYSSSSGPAASDMLTMSHQLAPGSYVEQSYAMSQNAANEQKQHQQHQHHQFKPTFVPRPTPSMSSSIYSDASGNLELNMYSSGPGMSHMPSHGIQLLPGKSKYPGSAGGQLVNFNGNFISMDVFQKSILPLMTQSPSAMSDLGNVEVITCQPGVRQPNQTDCTRYFVCSKKDGKVLSYSCPPYTGFNMQTRICDATTYAQCGNMPIFNGYSIDENRRLQAETLKALSDAKRRQEAAQKAQNIANLLQQYGQVPEQTISSPISSSSSSATSSMEQNLLDSYMISFPAHSSTIAPRPATMSPTLPPSSNSGGAAKKRKYYCREGDKIPDQTSISNYFVCYKNAQGQMKGHKMTCSKGLLFCPKTLMCTLATKCTG